MSRLLPLALALALLAAVLAGPAPAAAAERAWWNVPAETNKDLPPGLTPYHEIAPKLRSIDQRSDRVQVEVIGQSAQGRDLYLVTVSEPSARGRFGRYKALRNLMLRDPARAQERAADFEDFKVPFFVNASIHGDEWEGVDASLALIERLAFADDADTRRVLENTIVLFNVVQNPDGRVLGQRRNANGFDLNRDFITLSQPEVRATVEQLIEWHPMVLLDLHGYVNPYLIEPATPPHNPNYEYDLYIKWALDQADTMRDALKSEMGLDSVIPFRDWEDGWDDWPPIFTPMYAMYHGAYGHTLEAPFRVNRGSVSLPREERRERAARNKRAHETTTWAALQYAAANRRAMVHDQIEVFRRGWLDEPQVPVGDTHGDQHEFAASFPEAYVIPAGDRQRSETAAVELVNHLLDNDVRVERASAAFTAGGVLYPKGSYVVPMRQPKRGLANTILETGWDISDLVPVMYDISGWSHGELWGATRDAVPDGQGFDAQTTPVTSHQRADGSVAPGAGSHYALSVDGPAAVRAVNALLDRGFELRRDRGGRVYVPRAAETEVRRLASRSGLRFVPAVPPPGAEALDELEIAAAARPEELFTLRALGFDVEAVSTAELNAGRSLADDDVLLVTSGLAWDDRLGAFARTEITRFLERGGGLVGRGPTGVAFNDALDVLDVDHTPGPEDANGIARVTNAPGSPVASGAPGQTFVYGPVWFTRLGPGVAADQRFATGEHFLAGHWIGQDDAAGHAVVVHGTDDGRAVLFGSDPLFRAHPRGLHPQMAQALWWSAPVAPGRG